MFKLFAPKFPHCKKFPIYLRINRHCGWTSYIKIYRSTKNRFKRIALFNGYIFTGSATV